MGCRQRSKDPEHMRALALAAAGPLDDESTSNHAKRKSSRKCKPVTIGSSNSFAPLEVKIASNIDDDDFAADEQSSSESSNAESDIQELTNTEVRSCA
jgi:hypothetical protein